MTTVPIPGFCSSIPPAWQEKHSCYSEAALVPLLHPEVFSHSCLPSSGITSSLVNQIKLYTKLIPINKYIDILYTFNVIFSSLIFLIFFVSLSILSETPERNKLSQNKCLKFKSMEMRWSELTFELLCCSFNQWFSFIQFLQLHVIFTVQNISLSRRYYSFQFLLSPFQIGRQISLQFCFSCFSLNLKIRNWENKKD